MGSEMCIRDRVNQVICRDLDSSPNAQIRSERYLTSLRSRDVFGIISIVVNLYCFVRIVVTLHAFRPMIKCSYLFIARTDEQDKSYASPSVT